MTGLGVNELVQQMDGLLTRQARLCEFEIPATDGRRIAWLHAHGDIVSEESIGGDGAPKLRMTVRLNPKEIGQFETL